MPEVNWTRGRWRDYFLTGKMASKVDHYSVDEEEQTYLVTGGLGGKLTGLCLWLLG